MENTDEQINHIKGAVETLLFINEKPVTFEQIKKVFTTVTGAEIKKILKSLMEEYEQNKRGMTIIEIAGGHQMLSNPIYVSYARSFYKTKHKEKLSKPALETLAIIAYKQPVTRGDIELIRGVNSDGVTSHLVNKELIKIVGRRDVPGRPFLYGTTKQFMEYFGLKSLDDLPKMEEFSELVKKTEKEMEGVQAPTDELLSDEERIPDSVVPTNSLEQLKQNAIVENEMDEESLRNEEENFDNNEGQTQENNQAVVDIDDDKEIEVGVEDVSIGETEKISVKMAEGEQEQLTTAVIEEDEEKN